MPHYSRWCIEYEQKAFCVSVVLKASCVTCHFNSLSALLIKFRSKQTLWFRLYRLSSQFIILLTT